MMMTTRTEINPELIERAKKMNEPTFRPPRLAIGLAMILAFGGLTRAAPPKLEIQTTQIDLGQIVRGASAEARFELRNTGGETLEVIRVKPG